MRGVPIFRLLMRPWQARRSSDESGASRRGRTAFLKETEPLERDRNRVRAHRYERHFDVRHFQSLDDLQSQLDIFERLLGDLYLVLTRNSFIFRLDFHASAEGTAQDLADIMVHGSINNAVNAYGVARKTNKNPVPWYYFHREKSFESRPEPEDDQGGG